MKKIKKLKIWRAGLLFMLVFAVSVVLQAGQASASQNNTGSGSGSGSGTGSGSGSGNENDNGNGTTAVNPNDVPQGSFTPDDGKGLTYTFTGTAQGVIANVERYNITAFAQGGSLRIPSMIDHENGLSYPVGGVLRGVFSGCTSLTELILPDSLTYIGQEAFSGCTNLTSIQTYTHSSSNGNLGNAASGYLAAEEIEFRAFYGCTSLQGITLGEKLSGVGGVRTVQNEAFMDCSNLRSVEIRSTVNWIEGGAFANCQSLDGQVNGVKVQNNNLFFVEDGILYYKESNRSNVLLLCPAGTPVGILTDFPENVTQIRNQAFYGCRGLSSITIPNTVRTIGDKAFYDCIGLGNVTIPASVTNIGSQVFKNCSSGLCIICPGGSTAERYAIANNITKSVECTVTFYNTETRQSVEKKVMSGGTVDPPVGWERNGYVLRWTDDFNSSTIVNSNRTVNTVWKKLYTVTFRDQSANKESVVSGVEEGTEAAAPNWIKKGYKLTWSTENYKRVNSDMTVDAVWLVSMTDDTAGDDSQGQYKKGDLVTIGNFVYKISGYTDKRVRVMSLVDEARSTVTVPNTVSFGGRTYSVTCINANAFRGNPYITKITLGTNIRSIEHYAFYNCSRLQKVVINSKSLVNISNYAFKKTKTSLKVYVPTRGLIASYRTLLLDGGMSSKAKVVKKP